MLFGRKWQENIIEKIFQNTLSKCPGGLAILHQALKLNSKISAGKYKKKIKFTGASWISAGELSNYVLKNADIKRVVTSSKVQTAKEAFRNPTSMDNCQTFYSHVFAFLEGCCGLIPKCKGSVLLFSLIEL